MIVVNRIYNFSLNERLLNPYPSTFHPFDFCMSQLIAITHGMFEEFDCNPSLKVVQCKTVFW